MGNIGHVPGIERQFHGPGAAKTSTTASDMTRKISKGKLQKPTARMDHCPNLKNEAKGYLREKGHWEL